VPVAGTWSEEVVLEWLLLEGYFADVDVPLKSAKRGGRNEADIVGVKVRDGRLEVVHVEVGGLSEGFEKSVKTVMNKFADVVRDSVVEIMRERLGLRDDVLEVSYRSVFVATYASNVGKLKAILVVKV